MSARAASVCLEPGCAEVVTRGRCAAHRSDFNRRRGSAAARGYDAKHRRLTARALRVQPWCAWPGGCGYPIDEANPLTGDHDLALSRGGQTSPDNIVVLCKRHNSEKGTPWMRS